MGAQGVGLEALCERPGLLATRGPALAALVAAGAALPGLGLPFLSDDWAHLANVADGSLRRTPFGYFRPLCMATYRLEWGLWGLSPAAFHLTNLLLACATAALIVVAMRRYTGDARLAGAAGLLFALHPYHVETAAWIAARAEVLFSLLFIGAALAYDRWRAAPRGAPVAALVLFEAALLGKETAVTLPAFLLLIGLCDRRRRPKAAEWTRGHLPMAAVAIAHFLLLRPLAVGDVGFAALTGFGGRFLRNLMAFGAAAVLPAHIETLDGRPFLWGTLAVLVSGGLVLSARAASGRIPPLVWAAVPAFALLLGPSLVSFQERYLFLPSAASALALAALLQAVGGRARAAALLILVPSWLFALAAHWNGWRDAGRASHLLVDDLVEASLRPGVSEIVVANMPHRVHGAPVNADFSAAVALSGGRPAAVRSLTSIDYPDPRARAMEETAATATSRPPAVAEVRLRIEGGAYSRYVWPLPPPGSARLEYPWGTILFDGTRTVRVLIPSSARGSRAAYVWSGGRLENLF